VRVARAVALLLATLAIGAPAKVAAADGIGRDPTDCGVCHGDELAHLAATGGHSALVDCASCHADRRPGRVGRRHRAVAECRACHLEETDHPAREVEPRGRRATRRCLACHDVHGSTNLALVGEQIRWRRRLAAIVFTSEVGVGPGGFADPENPKRALCQTCHRDTEVYRRDGTGAAHFTAPCTSCHDHAGHFEAVATDANCSLCHADAAARLALPSAHSAAFATCSGCHAEVTPVPGPGHRAVESCESCHAEPATHAPSGPPGLPCAQCHEPHGSGNTALVRELLRTTQGEDVPLRFDNLDGRADGSFASASAPGTGICEVCHTTTQFYRADGTGAAHFTFSCLPCHRHAAGFAPQ
jgi:hypothetical protein